MFFKTYIISLIWIKSDTFTLLLKRLNNCTDNMILMLDLVGCVYQTGGKMASK